jgi:hypothetical protein
MKIIIFLLVIIYAIQGRQLYNIDYRNKTWVIDVENTLPNWQTVNNTNVIRNLNYYLRDGGTLKRFLEIIIDLELFDSKDKDEIFDDLGIRSIRNSERY